MRRKAGADMAGDKHTKTQAVVYARISSVKQTVEGAGLASQESRCRESARAKGYQVEAVFQDDVSGSLTSRPGMKALLTHVTKQKKRGTVVVIDDVSRLARGLEAHLALRAAIANAGGILESPSIEFGDDPDSQLVEYLLATVSQHARGKNAQQTVNRMRARLFDGCWPFQAPVGYRFARVSGGGKLLVSVHDHVESGESVVIPCVSADSQELPHVDCREPLPLRP